MRTKVISRSQDEIKCRLPSRPQGDVAWVVAAFNMHVIYDQYYKKDGTNVGTPIIKYKEHQSPIIDTVMMSGSGPVPATIATDIKGEVTGDKRFNIKITWKAGLANDCVFKIWDVSVRGIKEMTKQQSPWFTPSGCKALTKRSVTSCIATGLESDTSYRMKVREVCITSTASAYASVSDDSTRTRPRISKAPTNILVTASSVSHCEAIGVAEPSGPISVGDGLSIYCNNHNRGGGWTLLMSMSENSRDFYYESEHWEEATVLNDMDYKAESQKHSVYNTMKFTEFMAVFPGFKLGRSNEWYLKVDTPMTARTFFSKIRVIEGLHPDDLLKGWSLYNEHDLFAREDWYPHYFSRQNGAKSFGVKLSMPYMHSKWRVRWGYVFNDQNDFKSNDVGGGIGRSKHFLTSSTGDYYGGNGHIHTFANVKDAQYAVQIYGRYKNRPLPDESKVIPKLGVRFTPGKLHDCYLKGYQVRARKRNCAGSLIGADWERVGFAPKERESCLTSVDYSLDHQTAFSVRQICENSYANSEWSDATESKDYAEMNLALRVWGNRDSCSWAASVKAITDSVRTAIGGVFAKSTNMTLLPSSMVNNVITGIETAGPVCAEDIAVTTEHGFWHILLRQSDGAMYPLSTWYPKFQKQFPEAPQYSRLEDLEHFRMDTNGKFRYEPRLQT